MKLTIVLTVYNKEPFLHSAFNALLGQENVEVDDYEILVVNDGSTDGSLSVIQHYAECNSRLRILTQENQGLSMARNNGVESAKGDYVWFVDADDVISPYSVRMICDAMSSKPDIIPIYAQTEGIDKVRNCIPLSAQTGKDILVCGKWEPCGVFNIFKRSFLTENNLRFVPGIYHEDSEFTPRMLYEAKTVKVVPHVLYTVIHEPNSITQVPRSKRAFDYLIVAESIYRFLLEKEEAGTRIGKVFDIRISKAINNALSVIVRNSNADQKRFNGELKQKAYLFKSLRRSGVFQYKIEYLLFPIFSGHYAGVYKLLKHFG